jgi:hypothetical protein
VVAALDRSLVHQTHFFPLLRFRRGFLTGYVAKSLMTILPKIVRARGNVLKILPAIAHTLGPRGTLSF